MSAYGDSGVMSVPQKKGTTKIKEGGLRLTTNVGFFLRVRGNDFIVRRLVDPSPWVPMFSRCIKVAAFDKAREKN